MTEFEKAKLRARELDKLYPDIIHIVGVRYHIMRVREYSD